MKLLSKNEIDLSDFSRNLSDVNNTCYHYDIEFGHVTRLCDDVHFEDLERGEYTYIITSTSNIISSKIQNISEDGSKHLQIIKQAADDAFFLAGGEFCITQSSVIFNVYSGVFEENTNYNMENCKNEFLSTLHTIFEKYCDKKNICFTLDKLI